MSRVQVVYVTGSAFKIEEAKVLIASGRLPDSSPIQDLFAFDFRQLAIKETLDVDLGTMVRAEVKAAYAQLKVPCIVEHAGLVFSDYRAASYPGGLTKPMWNALGDKFVKETGSAGRRACARAVVAYCDGMKVYTFEGNREGRIADAPRGSRKFYWDTIFIPDDPTGLAGDRTYAEIVEDVALGLRHKVLELSQSTSALVQMLEFRRRTGRPRLWA